MPSPNWTENMEKVGIFRMLAVGLGVLGALPSDGSGESHGEPEDGYMPSSSRT